MQAPQGAKERQQGCHVFLWPDAFGPHLDNHCHSDQSKNAVNPWLDRRNSRPIEVKAVPCYNAVLELSLATRPLLTLPCVSIARELDPLSSIFREMLLAGKSFTWCYGPVRHFKRCTMAEIVQDLPQGLLVQST